MPPLSEAAQRALLRLARSTLEEQIGRKTAAPVEPILTALDQRAGAFVTLRNGELLRGCVGRAESSAPLFITVRECALCAARRDSRFRPVEPEELTGLSIEISVLSPIESARADEIEIGRHGLVVSRGIRTGLLLPQVPVTWKWDRARFLEETCLKAGLPPDAWKKGARIRVFTAQVFGERDSLSVLPEPASAEIFPSWKTV
ncbi:MAG: AmmeMemoRadiSam system protein A [Terriglobia bacterium]